MWAVSGRPRVVSGPAAGGLRAGGPHTSCSSPSWASAPAACSATASGASLANSLSGWGQRGGGQQLAALLQVLATRSGSRGPCCRWPRQHQRTSEGGGSAHRRSMISKNTVGRSPTGLVKICSSTPCNIRGAGQGGQGAAGIGARGGRRARRLGCRSQPRQRAVCPAAPTRPASRLREELQQPPAPTWSSLSTSSPSSSTALYCTGETQGEGQTRRWVGATELLRRRRPGSANEPRAPQHRALHAHDSASSRPRRPPHLLRRQRGPNLLGQLLVVVG